MKSDLIKSFYSKRDGVFSLFWFETVKTRFALCIIIVLFALTNPATGKLKHIFICTILYLLFNFSLGFVDSMNLQLKRWRAIPDMMDVVFISFIVHYTGGLNSSWFLLYFFPILSVSRYLSYLGCLALALLSTMAYGFLNFFSESNNPLDLFSFVLRCLVFIAIAVVAGSLTRTREIEEEKLIKVFEEIDQAILSNLETDKVLNLILKKAIDFTTSDMGQLHLLPNETQETKNITVTKQIMKLERNLSPLTGRYIQKVVDSKKPLFLNTIKKMYLKEDIENPLQRYQTTPKSALFVPLALDSKVIGIIAVYSRKRFHYTHIESIRLRGFAPLIVMAQKTTDLHRRIASAAKESKERLNMLHEIGEKLKAEQGLSDLFNSVVELTYSRLNSEEAALFITSPHEANQIHKVAVASPSTTITERLRKIEESYKKGESLTGGVFENRKSLLTNKVASDVRHGEVYSKVLPSGKIIHYMGVPLIIGDEIQGVIRVINKRGKRYSLKQNLFELSDEGFGQEDLELLQTIATQIASAIRNANFIETNRYFKNLVENSPDPIIVLDEKGKIQLFNKACEQLWDTKAKDAIGKFVGDFYESVEHAKEIGKELRKSIGHKIQNFEATIKHPSSEMIPISLSASLLFDKEGNSIGSIGVFTDLREIKGLQEAQTQSEKLAAIGKLSQTVGHDMKHDIATAQNYVSGLASKHKDDPELSRIYAKINYKLRNTVDKLHNMLMASRVKSPQKYPVRIASLFRSIDEQMQEQAKAKHVGFLIEYPQNEYKLNADADQIRQVLSNLFFNSIYAIEKRKHTGQLQEKGFIRISTKVKNDNLLFWWEDNGCGISKQNLAKIFNPFFTDKDTGNGLGLFIVKSIIENHDGSILVESEEGHGTCFEISLPVHKEVMQIKSE
jgi:PAS domain S-box-containing protein